jgi:hypothetical protein
MIVRERMLRSVTAERRGFYFATHDPYLATSISAMSARDGSQRTAESCRPVHVAAINATRLLCRLCERPPKVQRRPISRRRASLGERE